MLWKSTFSQHICLISVSSAKEPAALSWTVPHCPLAGGFGIAQLPHTQLNFPWTSGTLTVTHKLYIPHFCNVFSIAGIAQIVQTCHRSYFVLCCHLNCEWTSAPNVTVPPVLTLYLFMFTCMCVRVRTDAIPDHLTSLRYSFHLSLSLSFSICYRVSGGRSI